MLGLPRRGGAPAPEPRGETGRGSAARCVSDRQAQIEGGGGVLKFLLAVDTGWTGLLHEYLPGSGHRRGFTTTWLEPGTFASRSPAWLEEARCGPVGLQDCELF